MGEDIPKGTNSEREGVRKPSLLTKSVFFFFFFLQFFWKGEETLRNSSPSFLSPSPFLVERKGER